MAKRSPARNDQLRRALAHEAARIMLDQGIENFLLAKRKAADRLHVSDAAAMPRNAEIEAALLEQQRLFRTEHQNDVLKMQRESALRIMQLLKDFQPRLVGSVLSGTASPHADINLHVFTDQAEQIALELMERGIDFKPAERKYRYEAERVVSHPSFKFVAGQHAVEISVFPLNGLRQAPLSPVDGRGMQRATLTDVESLLK